MCLVRDEKSEINNKILENYVYENYINKIAEIIQPYCEEYNCRVNRYINCNIDIFGNCIECQRQPMVEDTKFGHHFVQKYYDYEIQHRFIIELGFNYSCLTNDETLLYFMDDILDKIKKSFPNADITQKNVEVISENNIGELYASRNLYKCIDLTFFIPKTEEELRKMGLQF